MDKGKMESCSWIKDVNGRLTLGEDEVKIIWKGYFEDLYSMENEYDRQACVKVKEGKSVSGLIIV